MQFSNVYLDLNSLKMTFQNAKCSNVWPDRELRLSLIMSSPVKNILSSASKGLAIVCYKVK